jgi:hypothetical protein
MKAGYVYFVQGVDGGPIKIGWTQNPEQRLEQLQAATHEELRLLDYVLGDRRVERALHDLLSDYRVRGEWFDDCGPVRDAVSDAVRGAEVRDLRESLRERIVEEVTDHLIAALEEFKSREGQRVS